MISVIIPVYNCERFIGSMLKTLQKQTYRDFEIICVDDGSTDGTLQKLKDFRESFTSMRIFTTENCGPSAARNMGIEVAQGEFICFLDADDQIETCYLEDLMEAMETFHTDLAVCYFDRVYEKKPGFLERSFRHIQNPCLKTPCSIKSQKNLLVELPNSVFAKLIRKDFLDRHQLRFAEGKIAQDFLFTKVMLMYGASVALCPKVNYHYQIRKGSITTGRLNKAKDLAFIFHVLMEEFQKSNLLEEYRTELEYLCLYHIGIDMAYRLFRSTGNLADSIAEAKKVMNKYGFSSNNPYVRNLNLAARLYLSLFY